MCIYSFWLISEAESDESKKKELENEKDHETNNEPSTHELQVSGKDKDTYKSDPVNEEVKQIETIQKVCDIVTS